MIKKFAPALLVALFLSTYALSLMKYGQLNVISKTERYKVFLDEKEQGLTPIKIDKVIAGSHFLKVVDIATQKIIFENLIQIHEGELNTIVIEEVMAINKLKYDSEKKDPTVAATLSLLIPGAGQFYNGDIGKGFAFILGAAISYYLATYEKVISEGAYSQRTEYPYQLIGMFGLAFCWIGSPLDARYNAIEKNERLRKQYGVELTYRENTPVLKLSHIF